MAVLLKTSLGEMVIDLYTDLCPLTTKNFLKLCKIKYYHNCLFHTVQKDFIVQTGDPTGTGSGGDSVYKYLYGEQARFFNDEIHQHLKHDKIGVVAMASAGENLNASQFYITTRADLDYLDGKHTVFGIVAEGEDTLLRINEAYVDEKNRPYKNIRIKHTYVLDDPFEDPVQLAELIPESSPDVRLPAEGEEVRLEDDWVPMDEQLDPEELDKSLRRKEAHSRAVVLEMIGDIPDAEIKPPENVLFVCKLNPVTQDEDLEIIFSQFGKVISADIIRDYKTGDSLCYAFIEFDTQEACEAAYFKMDNVLIDDRRIHVDFSQSVSRLWMRFRRFGKKDVKDGEGTNFALNAKSQGCFKCGAFGHFARDCPGEAEEEEKETTSERPKYTLKSTEGQHGGTDKRYDMVFDEGASGQYRKVSNRTLEEEEGAARRRPKEQFPSSGSSEDDDLRKYQRPHGKHDRHESKRHKENKDGIYERGRSQLYHRDERHASPKRRKTGGESSPEDKRHVRLSVRASTHKRHGEDWKGDHPRHGHRHRDGEENLRSRQNGSLEDCGSHRHHYRDRSPDRQHADRGLDDAREHQLERRRRSRDIERKEDRDRRKERSRRD